jgi:hypothetical protein
MHGCARNHLPVLLLKKNNHLPVLLKKNKTGDQPQPAERRRSDEVTFSPRVARTTTCLSIAPQ